MNDYKVIGPIAIGKTSSGYLYLVDTEDLEEVSQYTWSSSGGYLMAWDKTQSKNIYLHRIIMSVHAEAADHKSNIVHHRDHNISDNRKRNLELVSTQTNLRDCKLSKRNVSGFTGISYCESRDRYYSSIRVDGRLIMLGVFKKENLDDAIAARKAAEILYFQ